MRAHEIAVARLFAPTRRFAAVSARSRFRRDDGYLNRTPVTRTSPSGMARSPSSLFV